MSLAHYISGRTVALRTTEFHQSAMHEFMLERNCGTNSWPSTCWKPLCEHFLAALDVIFNALLVHSRNHVRDVVELVFSCPVHRAIARGASVARVQIDQPHLSAS